MPTLYVGEILRVKPELRPLDFLVDPQPPVVSPLIDIYLVAARHGVERDRQTVSGELDGITRTLERWHLEGLDDDRISL